VAQLLIAEGELAEALAPFRGTCPRCRFEVLVVDLAGEDVALEVAEVVEVFECPLCSGVQARGQARGQACYRCGDSGWVGEPLPAFGVALTEAGSVRVFDGWRVEGEAVYRVHCCLLTG
jgi:predicted RNA-binding Zn-ribbon protein involved in translation (DUF1610 family)